MELNCYNFTTALEVFHTTEERIHTSPLFDLCTSIPYRLVFTNFLWYVVWIDQQERCEACQNPSYLQSDDLFSKYCITWSNFVAKRFNDVIIPPFGPRLYCFMTSLYFTVSLMSMFAGYDSSCTAGSKLMTYGVSFFMYKCDVSRCIWEENKQKVSSICLISWIQGSYFCLLYVQHYEFYKVGEIQIKLTRIEKNYSINFFVFLSFYKVKHNLSLWL